MKQTLYSLFALCSALIATGCATGTHLVTGPTRPAIGPDQVQIYQIPPAKFDFVGVVNAQSPGNRQRNMDSALKELKRQAAGIGANGIILGGVVPGSQTVGVSTMNAYGGGTSFTGTGIGLAATGVQLSGQAIFVSPTQ